MSGPLRGALAGLEGIPGRIGLRVVAEIDFPVCVQQLYIGYR